MRRTEFLGRLARLSRNRAQPSAPVHKTLENLENAPSSCSDQPDVETFSTEVVAVGGHVHHAESDSAAAKKMVELLIDHGVRTAALGDSRLLSAHHLEQRLTDNGIEVVRVQPGSDPPEGARNSIFECDAGVTRATFGIAETGSIVELSSVEQPRSFSLVPPLHIAILRRSEIVSHLGDLVVRLESLSAAAPTAVTLITGPSRTGDIEQILTIGVHGPKVLHVVVLPSETAEV